MIHHMTLHTLSQPLSLLSCILVHLHKLTRLIESESGQKHSRHLPFVSCGMQPKYVFFTELIDSRVARVQISSVFPLSCLVCPHSSCKPCVNMYKVCAYNSLACSTKLSLQLTFLSSCFTSEVVQIAEKN